MNTCVVCLGEEDSSSLVEYNHCGIYHIHKDCLQRWEKDECIICREKIIFDENENENENENDTCSIYIALSLMGSSIISMICLLLIFI